MATLQELSLKKRFTNFDQVNEGLSHLVEQLRFVLGHLDGDNIDAEYMSVKLSTLYEDFEDAFNEVYDLLDVANAKIGALETGKRDIATIKPEDLGLDGNTAGTVKCDGAGGFYIEP